MRLSLSALALVVAAAVPVADVRTQSPVRPADTTAVEKELQTLCAQAKEADETEAAALATYGSPALESALTSEAGFWRFLTDPSTAYLDRLKAAQRGGHLVGPDRLPALWKAVADLEQTPSGVGPSPCMYIMSANLSPRMWLDRRTLDYPLTLDARRRAPASWQIQKAVSILVERVWKYYSDPERYPALVDAALRWQPSNFYENRIRAASVMAGPRNERRIEALVRLEIIGELYVCCGDSYHVEELVHAAQIVVLRTTVHEDAARQAAEQAAQLATDRDYSYNPQLKPLRTATAVLAVARWAMDRNVDLWTRYSFFAASICRMVDDPPFQPKDGLDRNSPEVARRMAAFERWYDGMKERFEQTSAAEKPHLRALSRELHQDAESIFP